MQQSRRKSIAFLKLLLMLLLLLLLLLACCWWCCKCCCSCCFFNLHFTSIFLFASITCKNFRTQKTSWNKNHFSKRIFESRRGKDKSRKRLKLDSSWKSLSGTFASNKTLISRFGAESFAWSQVANTELGSIRRKHNVRWQYLSRMKDRLLYTKTIFRVVKNVLD